MIRGKRVLAIIPARGGSKGLPRKNILPLAGKPLIAWTIEAARASRYIDRCIVSTDDAEIAQVAADWGGEVPFLRPAQLAQDDTPTREVILHALDLVDGYEYIVVLQPTSPLRLPSDIDGCLETMVKAQATTAVSVTKADKPPHWMYRLNGSGRLVPVLESTTPIARRQDAPIVYVLNGAVYAGTAEAYMKEGTFVRLDTVGYPMPRERSVDVDTELDLKICQWLLAKRSSSLRG